MWITGYAGLDIFHQTAKRPPSPSFSPQGARMSDLRDSASLEIESMFPTRHSDSLVLNTPDVHIGETSSLDTVAGPTEKKQQQQLQDEGHSFLGSTVRSHFRQVVWNTGGGLRQSPALSLQGSLHRFNHNHHLPSMELEEQCVYLLGRQLNHFRGLITSFTERPLGCEDTSSRSQKQVWWLEDKFARLQTIRWKNMGK